MKRCFAALLGAVALLIAAGCGGDDDDAQSSAPTTTVTETVTVTAEPAAPTGQDPKEVPLTAVPEKYWLELGEDRGKTVAVELAPGVWAERGEGALGELDDYTHVVGSCADVNQYVDVHGTPSRPLGTTC